MKIRYFMCKKCSRTSAGQYSGTQMVQCGALVGFVIQDGEEVPYGCGGELAEISQEEATNRAYINRR